MADQNVTNLVVDAAADKLPLTVALRTAAAESPSARRQMLLGLCERIEAGESIDSALAATGNSVPHYLQVLLHGAAKTPNAGRILSGYLEQARRSSDRWRQLRVDLASPMVLCTAMVAIFLFVVIWLIPQFTKIFTDFGTKLPVMTEFLIGLSDLFLHFVPVWILMAAALSTLAFAAWNSAAGRSNLWRLPLIGLPLRSSVLADFTSFLALLVEFRTPLHEAVLSASDAANDPWLRQVCQKISTRLQSGESPAQAVGTIKSFPATLRHSFRYATDPEAFRDALASQATIFNSTAETTSSTVPLIIGPMAVMGTALFATLTAIALFAPLVALLNDLS